MTVLIQHHWRLESAAARTLNELTRQAVREALETDGGADGCEVSVLFTGDEEMRQLNEKYRGVAGPTDVLSFSLIEGESPGIPGEPEVDVALGDIVISLETAERQAALSGHSVRREIAILLIHGALHLLGRDHNAVGETKQMSALERNCLGALQSKLII